MNKIKIVIEDTNGINISEKSFSFENMTILEALNKAGIVFHSPCGGKNICKKCLIKILDNEKEKFVQSCQTEIKNNMIIYVTKEKEIENLMNKNKNHEYALCLDLGTTTMVFALVDINDKAEVREFSALNPQGNFGSDVISRIQYSIENGIQDLHLSVIRKVSEVLLAYKDFNIKKIFVSGNPTMLHLFANEKVESLGKYPYEALFLEEKRIIGKTLNLSVEEIILLPSFSSFVGSDISCGVLETKLYSGNNVLIDLGTNGEIVLSLNGKLFITSTAAGPAFEGAGIECGCGGISGGINKISKENDGFVFKTINNKEPIGFTGSALVDAISLLKKENIIDSSGSFKINEKKFYFSENIYLTQKDIRNFQLAKSAIRTGLDILLKSAKASYKEIDHLYIAGGFGNYLDINNAMEIGLLPRELVEKYENVGNTALSGTIKVAFDSNNLELMNKFTKEATLIDLNKEKDFLEIFAENIEL